MRLVLPRLYVILDAVLLTIPETDCAQKLADAGVRLLQYRNKSASSRELFEASRRLSSRLVPQGVWFLVNDRADLASVVDATGVHVGQEDLSAEAARQVIGEGKWVGVSTHNLEQFERARRYIRRLHRGWPRVWHFDQNQPGSRRRHRFHLPRSCAHQ